MRHAILGPGGVGGLMAACLAKLGNQVTLVVRPETLEQYPHQLQLESPFGNFTVEIERAVQVPPADVVWITVKATQLEDALRSMPTANGVRAIIPLLNGIDHVALLRSRYDADRVVPATIAGETERVTPGHIVHRTPFARLQVAASGRELLSATLDQFQGMGFICHFIEDEATLLWGKLALLAPLALTTTAAGATKGQVANDPAWGDQFVSCVREACAVGAAEGAHLDVEKGLAALLGLPDGMRSSMQKDVEQGKPPELDAIGGPILRGGARHGIPVPTTSSLVSIVEKKSGSRLTLT